ARMFLLLLLVSSTMCAGNYSYLGTGASLAVCQPDTCALLSEVAAMKEKLASMTHTQNMLEQNLSAQDEQLKVAFTAALGSSMGPFGQDTPVKYQRILSNIGSSYNPATGIFTAMVRGVYYFTFTMYNNNSGQPNSVVSLMLNSQRVVSTWDTEGEDIHDSATNAALLRLEAGDNVFVKLYANRVLYDDGNYYNTFSGFLVFNL
uniref:C1q domain-containing protein n=1 Tax=Mastacembelus armatus TaxID=205130 RepID=A0A3Q3S712_9TELE